jgi:hypothetical protein
MHDRRLGSAQVVGPTSVTLIEVLDRVLDKGLVVAGDIRISLASVELLSIQLRLLVCSIDKAEEIGMNWGREDRFFTTDAIERRLDRIERRLGEAPPRAAAASGAPRRAARARR